MKKTYQKPVMIMLSLTGNEQLCGSCKEADADFLLNNDKTGLADLLGTLVGNLDGTLTKNELENVFGSGEGCAEVVDMYCKFTGDMKVAWS